MCNSCGSDRQSRFTTEIAIHFQGAKNISKPHVFVFPELVVCLKCGKAELTIPERELRMLAEGEAAGRIKAGSSLEPE